MVLLFITPRPLLSTFIRMECIFRIESKWDSYFETRSFWWMLGWSCCLIYECVWFGKWFFGPSIQGPTEHTLLYIKAQWFGSKSLFCIWLFGLPDLESWVVFLSHLVILISKSSIRLRIMSCWLGSETTHNSFFDMLISHI